MRGRCSGDNVGHAPFPHPKKIGWGHNTFAPPNGLYIRYYRAAWNADTV